MFKTKKDVDRHVQDINSKVKSASERNLKGYSIAKLYFGVLFRRESLKNQENIIVLGRGLRKCEEVCCQLPPGEGHQRSGPQTQWSDP